MNRFPPLPPPQRSRVAGLSSHAVDVPGSWSTVKKKKKNASEGEEKASESVLQVNITRRRHHAITTRNPRDATTSFVPPNGGDSKYVDPKPRDRDVLPTAEILSPRHLQAYTSSVTTFLGSYTREARVRTRSIHTQIVHHLLFLPPPLLPLLLPYGKVR